jgi:hypothetical protein
MGVHGNVAEDVMEDIGLGDVLKRFPAPQPSRSRELPGGKHGKEGLWRQKTAHGGSSPATPGPKPLIHLGQVWDQVGSETYLMKTFQIFLAGMRLNLGHAPAYQLRPGGVLLSRVGGPLLLDQVRFCCTQRC